MKKLCAELVSFFQNQEGWDKDELLNDYVAEILKDAKSETLYADELLVSDEYRDIMVLSEFASSLFDKIMVGVCNVIESA